VTYLNRECVGVGVLPQEGGLGDLPWNSNSKKVYVNLDVLVLGSQLTGFYICSYINSFVKAMGLNVNITWINLNYLAWDLMRSS